MAGIYSGYSQLIAADIVAPSVQYSGSGTGWIRTFFWAEPGVFRPDPDPLFVVPTIFQRYIIVSNIFFLLNSLDDKKSILS